MQPGEALLTGQINGQQLGQALFAFGPTLPHEAPIPMPRALARQLFPQGFQPFRAPTMAPPVPLIPAAPAPVVPVAAPPVVPVPAVDERGNQIERRQPLPPAPPRKRVLERGSFPAWVM